MSCERCKDTSCILWSRYDTPAGTRLFVDLRFDVENTEFDMKFGTCDEDGFALDSDWSGTVKIAYCPFCGGKLEPEI